MASDSVVGKNPLPLGDRWVSVLNHYGPASYTQVTPGASPSGGDSITAATFGLKYIEAAWCELDNTGAYMPIALSPTASQTSIILRWLNATGGTEVAGSANLSASSVRIMAIGR